ncbi:Checkpoint serine/threonine-protein kinase bub1 [Grifola frondosa]|uniref:Checkpoint serine/threonine-protein kinase bub1 n=1 Tax=Grifola frondosa TaxID=5627 RepID=A0A1C7M8F5_GRIFR|nr:Checkpoint serine/threonine-protein kinase bub1 [Grifola frondosa]
MDPSSSSTLSKKRERYRAQLATALQEDADPLAAYDDFIKWTQDNYPDSELARSGLLELLEEATRQFVGDAAYKSDLRYLKLWLLYASHVEDPTTIYAFLIANEIGVVYALTYQGFADALERCGRRSEVEMVYRMGIQRRARPLEPLKKRFEEFKSRAGSPSISLSISPSTSSAALWKTAPPETQALRRAPLKYHPSTKPVSPASATSSDIANQSHGHNRYALMLAPPAPGKRPEKLRFNLSLLFTDDGIEYSMQEARARSMGLLGKKWGPPPPSELNAGRGRVAFDSGGLDGRSTRTFTQKGFAEPTVTLATKEALADVFGMYNSPEKSTRFGVVDTKHAPIRKIEPMTPMAPLQSHFRATSDENANVPSKTPTGTFRPFVDENVGRKENSTPAPPPKFQPYFDPEEQSKPPLLSVKEPSAPPANAEDARNTKRPDVLRPPIQERRPATVFSLAPSSIAPKDKSKSRLGVFTDDQARNSSGSTSPTEVANVFHPATVVQRAPTKITPFVDPPPPVRVFSRPPPRNENAPASSFTPFIDKDVINNQPLHSSGRPILAERIPLRAFAPPPIAQHHNEQAREQESEDDSEYTEDDDYGYVNHTPQETDDDSMYDDVEDDAGSHVPLGGRFGQFDVMTPITERTGEYNLSTRVSNSSNNMPNEDPVAKAEQLAAEVRADRDEEEATNLVSATAYIEEKTDTLSLSDALTIASSFKPPNPCNPFDPPTMSTLLSLVPPDQNFHDLRSQEAEFLDALQKFAKKKSRRTSGNSASSRMLDDGETMQIGLSDRQFAVTDKLGEGGFGAVFEAIDLDAALCRKIRHEDDEDDEDEEDEDEDDQDDNKVALKVVKPRNLWEFHVLRNIHTTLPVRLRQSVISPQALYAFRDESYLILELCKQGTLLDIVNRAGKAGITQQGACLDELLVVFFAIELMRLLEGLHKAGFIHGDVKIDNCLLRLEDVPGSASAWTSVYQPSGEGGWGYKGIKMIDFGRTIDTRLFPASQRYIAEWPTDARDCLEMREGKPWTFQTDYFGLAGIIYCMLYGKYIEASSVVETSSFAPDGTPRYRLATPFKRYWQVDIWTRLFDVLLNPCLVRPDGQLPLCEEMEELRLEMETWLQENCNRASNSLKGLLKKVGLAVLGGKEGR